MKVPTVHKIFKNLFASGALQALPVATPLTLYLQSHLCNEIEANEFGSLPIGVIHTKKYILQRTY